MKVHRQRPIWFAHTQAGFGYLGRAEGTRYEAANREDGKMSEQSVAKGNRSGQCQWICNKAGRSYTEKNITLYQVDISMQYHSNTKRKFHLESTN